MELIKQFIEFFLHIDVHLDLLIQNYGVWSYLILFLIIFCETGLVVTPILPGDSLLFAAGTFAARGSFDVYRLALLLFIAAVLGNTVNYKIGCYIGPRVFEFKNSRIFKKEYLEKTHGFFEKYGGKTIIITRFLPIVRTFAPFLAGVGTMSYLRFQVYNFVGGALWIGAFVFGGNYFGNQPFVRKNFTYVIVAIIVVSFIPTVVEYLRIRKEGKEKAITNKS